MNILLVGGKFDNEGGKPSGYIKKFGEELLHETLFNRTYFYYFSIKRFINGGNYSELQNAIDNLQDIDVVLWFADVPNDLPKLVDQIKVKFPKIYLVISKRNFDNEYSTKDLVNRALKVKANLLIEFTGNKNNIKGSILDPLGMYYEYKAEIIPILIFTLMERLLKISKYTRVSSKQIGDAILAPENEKFYSSIKEQAEKFHEIIHGVGHERMMGNASFRCAKGFPSMRDNDLIFVSSRNVDKRYIGKEAFVAVNANSPDNIVEYYGDVKPSVDTPIQLKLYKHFKNINYMLHSHTYISGCPFTSEPIPCGAIEEADEIIKLIPNEKVFLGAAFYGINLIGHGSIVMSENLEDYNKIQWRARPQEEKFGC